MNVFIAPRSLGQSTKDNYYCNSKQLPGESIWPVDEFRPQEPEVFIFKRMIAFANIFYLSFKKSFGNCTLPLFLREKAVGENSFL